MGQIKLVYTLEEHEPVVRPSIFLAGPTPRREYVESWRPKVLRQIFRYGNGEDLTVFYPEPREKQRWNPEKNIHRRWEKRAMETSTIILFWIPRNLKTMPGFTTNLEWGFWMGRDPSKVVLGFPAGAPKMDPVIDDAEEYGIKIHHSYIAAVRAAVGKALAAK